MPRRGSRFGNVPLPILLLGGGGLIILVIVIVLVTKSSQSSKPSMTTPLQNAPKPTESQQKLISQVAPPIGPSQKSPGVVLTAGQLGGVVPSITLDDGTKITTRNPTDMYPNIGPKEAGGCNFDSKTNTKLSNSTFMYNQISGTCVSCLDGGTLDTSTGVARCVTCDDYTKFWDPSKLKCVSSPSKNTCPPGQIFNTSTSFGPLGCIDQGMFAA